MKKICTENGKIIAYIKNSDIEVLKLIKDVVPESVFEEKAIKEKRSQDNSYYRIENIDNVHYIKSLNFIANEDYLDKLNNSEIQSILTQFRDKKKKVLYIVDKLYNRQKLTKKEEAILRKCKTLQNSLIDELLEKAYIKNNSNEEARFIKLAGIVVAQLTYYLQSIEEYMHIRIVKEQNV